MYLDVLDVLKLVDTGKDLVLLLDVNSGHRKECRPVYTSRIDAVCIMEFSTKTFPQEHDPFSQRK